MNRKRKVLLIIENDGFPSDSRVVNESRILVSAGYQVSVICPRFRGQKLHEVVNDISVYRYPMPFHPRGLTGYFWEYSYSLLALFMTSLVVFITRGFSVVHTQNPPDFLFVIGLFYKLFGRKFIFDHNDLTPELYLTKYGSAKLAFNFLVWQESLSCRVADLVITTGNSYQELEITRDKIPPSKIILVRNSPNLSRVKSLVPAAAPVPAGGGAMTLGYLGYLDPQDGVDLLLEALHHLAFGLSRRDFRCVIIGDGEMLEELKQTARRTEIEDFIEFTGRLPWEEAMKRIATVDICLEPCPSNPFNDKTSTVKVFEYMALRKPIVAFDLQELRSVIGGAALLARNDDAREFAMKIEQLMNDAMLRETMAAAGQAKIETEFNWENYATNLLQAYDKLLPDK